MSTTEVVAPKTVIRDQVGDHLLTPKNAAMVVLDYQPSQLAGLRSMEAHRAGLDRVVQAGAKPTSWVALAVELQRDWARLETVQEVVQIVLTERLLKEA